MARFLLSLLLLLPTWAIEPSKTVMFGRGYQAMSAPTFDQGYLLFTKPLSGSFEVWGPDGLQRFFATVENPPGASVASLAVDSDGSVAAGFGFRGPEGVSGGIAYFDPSGKQTRFVDTGKYLPAHVCFDRNHSLWTFGSQRDSSGDYEEPSDYMMFRKYSADGKEAGRYGPRSIMPTRGLEPGGAQGGLWRLRVADDRVGALAYSGKSSLDNQVWIELGLDGRLIGKWTMGRNLQGGLAFTRDARLCRQTPGKTMPGIECFDRGTGVWKEAGDAPTSGLLLGAQGDELVFSRDEGVIRLYWVKVP
jgi:hypothetical protein